MSYWGLVLCDMRSSRIEEGDRIVAWAETPEALLALIERERVEPYRTHDGRWFKAFRQGGPLEWSNESNSLRWNGTLPPDAHENGLIVPIATPDEAAERARSSARTFLDMTPKATDDGSTNYDSEGGDDEW